MIQTFSGSTVCFSDWLGLDMSDVAIAGLARILRDKVVRSGGTE